MISEWWECVKEGLILLTGSERMGRGQSCPFHKGTFLWEITQSRRPNPFSAQHPQWLNYLLVSTISFWGQWQKIHRRLSRLWRGVRSQYGKWHYFTHIHTHIYKKHPRRKRRKKACHSCQCPIIPKMREGLEFLFWEKNTAYHFERLQWYLLMLKTDTARQSSSRVHALSGDEDGMQQKTQERLLAALPCLSRQSGVGVHVYPS